MLLVVFKCAVVFKCEASGFDTFDKVVPCFAAYIVLSPELCAKSFRFGKSAHGQGFCE